MPERNNQTLLRLSEAEQKNMTLEVAKCPAIKTVGLSNPENTPIWVGKTFRLDLELCPLYTSGTPMDASTLSERADNEDDILGSRVGNKWVAIKHTLNVINTTLANKGCQLEARATYADIGVLAANPEATNPTAILRHGELYEKLLSGYCQEKSIPLTFRHMSDVVVEESRRVPNFLITDPKDILGIKFEKEEDLVRHLLKILKIEDEVKLGTKSLNKRAEVLWRTLQNSGWNIGLWKGLVHQYVYYLEKMVEGCDMRLGVERAEMLLTLPRLRSNSPLAKMQILNILVN
jgi:hypothetical protein